MASHYKDGKEVITSTLEATTHFDFQAILRKYFGLVGEFYSEEYKAACAIEDDDLRSEAFNKILDENGPAGYYTKEANEAWHRATDFIEDLEDAGIIDSDIKCRITSCFCDNAG